MSVRKDLKQIRNAIRTMNESIESQSCTIRHILESLDKLSALTAELAELVTPPKSDQL